ncbi:MAG: diaminopimelate decarboxylase [Pseudomonadota bacterium]|nr:diaminopimelate decarboxylase [Pseudomonadota bacterium]
MKTALDAARLRALAHRHGTPLWIYDAAIVRARIAALRAFDTLRFAQKACSNTHILRLMRGQGVSVDAVSQGEIARALHAGYRCGVAGEPDIVFTADLIDAATLETVVREGIPVNAGSIDMLAQLGARAPGHPVWLRINPGFGHGHSNKTNTGGEHSKHGIWHTDLPAALAVVQAHGLRLVGLHMHIGSGVDYGHLEHVAEAMVALVADARVDIEAVSAGGGLSIPYRESDPVVDVDRYFRLWDQARRAIASRLGHAVRLELEPGRYLVAESGLLLAEVRATKFAGTRHFTLVDAGFNDLMRPAMYGAFHAASVLPADGSDAALRPLRETTLAGPLCESGDVFTQGDGGIVQSVQLPAAQVGDLLVLHDTGAYGAAMSSNYNSRPLLPEVLIDGDDSCLIRRRQSIDELIALEQV